MIRIEYRFGKKRWVAGLILILGAAARSLHAADIERAPIQYSRSQGDNPITRLQQRLESGQVQLEYASATGWLSSLLKELNIPSESQTLVFSKTSLQRNRISPRTPRAVYFNDDIYIGFCRGGSVLEVSVADSKLGTEYYTLPQDPSLQPKFARQTDECLICHASSATQGIPGHLLRSVFVDYGGTPLLSHGSFRVDPSTPWEKRFGGWFVTSRNPLTEHLGNAITSESSTDKPSQKALPWKAIESGKYLESSSDVLAHLILTHQIHVHNKIAKLSIETQLALDDEQALNRELNEGNNKRWESTTRRIQSHAKDLVKAMLFFGEARLPCEIDIDSSYAHQFEQKGPFDRQGRTLRKLQARDRVLAFPCSYLIYSDAFAQLPREAKLSVIGLMHNVLIDDEPWENFEHLSDQDRKDIVSILVDTLPGDFGNWAK